MTERPVDRRRGRLIQHLAGRRDGADGRQRCAVANVVIIWLRSLAQMTRTQQFAAVGRSCVGTATIERGPGPIPCGTNLFRTASAFGPSGRLFRFLHDLALYTPSEVA